MQKEKLFRIDFFYTAPNKKKILEDVAFVWGKNEANATKRLRFFIDELAYMEYRGRKYMEYRTIGEVNEASVPKYIKNNIITTDRNGRLN